MAEDQVKITGVILAGGLARRMGGRDKGLIKFSGRPLVSFAIDALAPVVDEVVINANRNHKIYAEFGCRVISDETTTFDGPLAGLSSAMKSCDSDFVLTVPCDCPMINSPALQRMVSAVVCGNVDGAVANDGERLQPVVLIIHTRLLASLETYLRSGNRKIDTWLMQHEMAMVDYSDQTGIFRNVNTPEELNLLEKEFD